MQLDEVIAKRHSCRTYLPTPVTDEQIRQIVEAGRLSPSAKNAQPWKVVCLKTNNKSTKVSDLMKEYYINNKDNPENLRGAGSVFATAKILEDCPAILLIFEDSEDIDRDKVRDISTLLSIGSFVEHMVLKATDLGLGSLWICDTFFVQKEIGKFIDKAFADANGKPFINSSNRLVCALALGYRGDDEYATQRKPVEQILQSLDI